MTKFQKSPLLISLVILLQLVVFSLPAHAQTGNTKEDKRAQLMPSVNDNNSRILPKKEDIEARKLKLRCDGRDLRIQNKIKMFDSSHRFHQDKFKRIYDRITNLVERLNSNDVDTTELSSHLQILGDKIETVNTKYDALIQSLKNLQTARCDTTEEMNNSLKEVRDLLAEVKQASQDVKDYLILTIKPDLAALREEIKDLKSKPEESTESTDSD